MLKSLREHWVEYLIEAGGLGLFMTLAGVCTVAVEVPGSPIREALSQAPLLRRALIGLAMGTTAISVIYSTWGKRSGAHLNPAVTLTFYRLGKLRPWDAVFYILAQCLGGLIGVVLVSIFLGPLFTDPPVMYVATVPNQMTGLVIALMVEFLMAFGLMTMVLWVSNSSRYSQFTGVFSGILIAFYITLLAPFSGMSINPARSFASALPSQIWTGWWIYLIGPTLAMQVAAEVYLRISTLVRDPDGHAIEIVER